MNEIKNDYLPYKLQTEKYFYHSVGGFNLDKLTSILAVGILSKDQGSSYGVDIQSTGFGLNGSRYVSVSNRIDADSYSGTYLGLIIEPTGLDFFQKFGPEHIPFERQIYGKIPKENIIGITIPPSYISENFAEIEVLYTRNIEIFKKGMNSLEKFYSNTLGTSLLANEKLKLAYNNVIEFKNKDKEIRKNNDIFEAIEQSNKLKNETQLELNLALMECINEVYKTIFIKDSYNLVDIIRHHTDLPIYFTTGELVTPLTIESKIASKKEILLINEDNNEESNLSKSNWLCSLI